MARESLRGFLQLGFFLLVAGGITAVLLPPDSGEFVLSVCSSGIGLALVVGAILAYRLLQR